MRFSPRSFALAGIVVAGLMVFGTAPARAQGYGYPGGGYYGQGYGGYYGQGYGGNCAPRVRYYGNGGHDYQPHWHTTQGPFGSFAWYGNGAHDLAPHEHENSAYGGYRGYSPAPFGGVTTSYYPSSPYVYMPW